MEPIVVKLSKTISAVAGDTTSYRLILRVVYAQGMTDAIFVHQYLPGSPYTGSDELSFHNVAYPDELQTIPVRSTRKSTACYVRTNRVDKYFRSLEDIDSFMATVVSDMSKLIKHLETFDDMSESSGSYITVTGDNNYEVVADVGDVSEDTSDHCSCACPKYSADELITDLSGTIIVDVSGK